ncbi:poly-gamma-glutamate hydrolase family protein [Embleya sp. NPDC059237]|uniref:poly-gamma-glutamate hydrolase family protein n=1 Tax=Embleya sp. NPDC059237 TaxID=3346784 RepID=UPI0036A7A364
MTDRQPQTADDAPRRRFRPGRRTFLAAGLAATFGVTTYAANVQNRASADEGNLDDDIDTATTNHDAFTSNTALYASTKYAQVRDWDVRFRRHGVSDDNLSGTVPFPQFVILAPHGGGIERGTSEICLALAGYRPDTLKPRGGPVFDYWMFEGLREDGNDRLHVTSSHCDDPVACSLVGGMRHAVSLHGCTAEQAKAKGRTGQAVVVGGGDKELRDAAVKKLDKAGFEVIAGTTVPALAGLDPRNIVNRTLTDGGLQLELTTELREAMFKPKKMSRSERPSNTTEVFERFVAAVRDAMQVYGPIPTPAAY